MLQTDFTSHQVMQPISAVPRTMAPNHPGRDMRMEVGALQQQRIDQASRGRFSRRAFVLFGALVLTSTAPVVIAAATSEEPPSAAEVRYAVAEVVACQAYLRTVVNLVRDRAFEYALPYLSGPPFSTFASAANVLSKGPTPVLRHEGVVLASEVLASFMALRAAVQGEDGKAARAAAKAAQGAIDDILVQCKDAGVLEASWLK